MPERYNFVTGNFDEAGKGEEIFAELINFAENVKIHAFQRVGGRVSYFITGQSIEVDSNCGCIELATCLKEHSLSAVFINDPSEYGFINAEN